MMSSPNILIIKSDQHNARCLGVNGHKQVKTPNLDQMAREGVNFTKAFVQNPICTPSRMCYLTGEYVHNHGQFGLEEESRPGCLPAHLPSIMSIFKDNGYSTGIVGHIHVQESWLKPHCDMYRDMYAANDNCYDAYLDRKGLLPLRDDVAWDGNSQTFDSCASGLSFEDSCEGYCLQSFSEFLDNQPGDRPFVFQMDPLHPHEDWIPVKQFWDMYEGVELDLPPSADEDLSSKPVIQQMVKEGALKYPWLFDPKTYEAGRLRKLRGYYGCISQVDYMVGLVRQMLREREIDRNTIIVYCTDHGDFALEHGFLEKAPGISYDAILRTPFIWCRADDSFHEGSVVEELVESVDLFPTICSLAGIDAPDTIDGQDITPMLKGNLTPVRDFVVAEFPLSRTIRTKEWKLCHRPRGISKEMDDAGELYNVVADPWEMNNLYSVPQFTGIREELRRILFEWTQLTTRYGNMWPGTPAGQDGRTTPDELKRMAASQWGSVYL
ncbi:MAG: sulfatase family protein [Armatimonadota bacterium]